MGLEINFIHYRYARNAWQVSEIELSPTFFRRSGPPGPTNGGFKDAQMSQKGLQESRAFAGAGKVKSHFSTDRLQM